MSDRNWEAELAKIDKQIASVSDEALLASSKPVAPGKAAPGKAAAAPSSPAPSTMASGVTGSTWFAWVKVSVAVAAAAGLMFWPWPARCGLPLMGFTAATGGVALLGVWSALGTWRHRLGLAHLASILVTAWGLMLGAREVLPRVGYAVPTIERAGQWSCDGLPALPPPVQNAPPSTTETSPPAGTPGEGLPR